MHFNTAYMILSILADRSMEKSLFGPADHGHAWRSHRG